MAGRIKGITVEIGGDTSKLSDALKGVNKEIKNTQSQLKDVEKLLKLDPGNTELLAQKHRLLGDAADDAVRLFRRYMAGGGAEHQNVCVRFGGNVQFCIGQHFGAGTKGCQLYTGIQSTGEIIRDDQYFNHVMSTDSW